MSKPKTQVVTLRHVRGGTIRGERVAGWLTANQEEASFRKFYVVGFRDTTMPGILVNSDNEGDALDDAADAADEFGYKGWFVPDDEVEEMERDGYELTFVGNHGMPMDMSEIYIEEVREPPKASLIYRYARRPRRPLPPHRR